jgi:hypothetical protein
LSAEVVGYVQALVDFRKQDSATLAALSQLTTFVRIGREDVLNSAVDPRNRLPKALRDVESLAGSEDAEIRAAAEAFLTVCKRLENVMNCRCERVMLHEECVYVTLICCNARMNADLWWRQSDPQL